MCVRYFIQKSSRTEGEALDIALTVPVTGQPSSPQPETSLPSQLLLLGEADCWQHLLGKSLALGSCAHIKTTDEAGKPWEAGRVNEGLAQRGEKSDVVGGAMLNWLRERRAQDLEKEPEAGTGVNRPRTFEACAGMLLWLEPIDLVGLGGRRGVDSPSGELPFLVQRLSRTTAGVRSHGLGGLRAVELPTTNYQHPRP